MRCIGNTRPTTLTYVHSLYITTHTAASSALAYNSSLTHRLHAQLSLVKSALCILMLDSVKVTDRGVRGGGW